MKIPTLVVTYVPYSPTLSGVTTPNFVIPNVNNVEITWFMTKKPKTAAKAAVALSFLAKPAATPTANKIGKFPKTISPIFFIIVKRAVINCELLITSAID